MYLVLLKSVKDPVFMQIKKEFENRINRVFLHPSLGDVLDNGEIDFIVMQIIEELARVS